MESAVSSGIEWSSKSVLQGLAYLMVICGIPIPLRVRES